MAADANSSMQIDNVDPRNTNDVTADSHRLPPISEKTKRELQASAEYFMRIYGKQSKTLKQKGYQRISCGKHDRCRQRRVKCSGPEEGDPQSRCTSCRMHKQECVFPPMSLSDIYIVVMGATGAGKSRFIQECSGQDVRIGHSLESCTTKVDEYTFPCEGKTVHLVDTPGFRDTYKSDRDVLEEMAKWIGTAYEENHKLHGILYLHRITDARVSGTSMRNLLMFKKLCGDDFYPRVFLVGTMWDKVSDTEGRAREDELVSNSEFWGIMVDKGAKVMRHQGDRDSAMAILVSLINRDIEVEGPRVLQLQKELVDKECMLHETSAGQYFESELIKQRERYAMEVERIQEDIKMLLETNEQEAAEELQRTRVELEARIAQSHFDQTMLWKSFRDLQRHEAYETNSFKTKLEEYRTVNQVDLIQTTERASRQSKRSDPKSTFAEVLTSPTEISLSEGLGVSNFKDHLSRSTSSPLGSGSDTIPYGPSMEHQTGSDPADDLGDSDALGDLDALLNPSKYFTELDELEQFAIDKCRLTSILPSPRDGVVDIHPHLLPSHREDGSILGEDCATRTRWATILNNVDETIRESHNRGFSNGSIIVLIQDAKRANVICARTIVTSDITQLQNVFAANPHDLPETISLLQQCVDRLLHVFGISSNGFSPAESIPAIELLCLLLPLAIVSYTGSHCSDLGWAIFDNDLDSVNFQGVLAAQGRPYSLRRRNLACLRGFIGGPVWTFGNNEEIVPASLSMSIEQFADLWGPLYAVPSTNHPSEVLAIHTEGGILFHKGGSTDSVPLVIGETPLHWIAISPVHKPLGEQDLSPSGLTTYARQGERLPDRLTSFTPSRHYLIGVPSSTTNSVTSTTTLDTIPRLALQLNSPPGLNHNICCGLDLEEFGKLNTFRLHAIGTSSEHYLPEEYQLGFGGGQYINVGLQKVYKRRPAITHKTRILECLSKPRGLRPCDVQKVLQCFLGLEMSACTRNAQRVILASVLKLAYPSDLQGVEKACSSGDGLEIARYLCDLEKTGVGLDSKANLFWPVSTGIPEALELSDLPAWFKILKDTRDSACFAVASPRCLSFIHHDKDRVYERTCSLVPSRGSPRPVLGTTVELDPADHFAMDQVCTSWEAFASWPWEAARLQLPVGQLQLQSQGTDGQLAFFKPKGTFSKWNAMLNPNRLFAARELLNPSRKSLFTGPLLIIDQP